MTTRRSASGAQKKPRWSAAKKASLSKKPRPATGGSMRQDRASSARTAERDVRWTRPERSGRVSEDRNGRSSSREHEGRRPYRDDRRSYGERDSRPSYGERDSRPSYGERETSRSSGERNTGRSYGDRDKSRSYGERDKGRSYGDRDSRLYGERDKSRSYGERDKSRSYGERDSRSSYGERDSRSSYGERDKGRSYGERNKGRSYGDRDGNRSYDDRGAGRSERESRQRSSGFEQGEGTSAQVDARRIPRERDHRVTPHDAPRADAERMRRREAPVVEPVEPTESGFADLGLPDALVRRLARDGISEPFPIQTATIPDALAGRDVLGRGRTGSGKTFAFGLPVLTRLAQGARSKPRRPRALILSPTRELAMQISDALQPLVHVMGLSHKLVAGGMPYPPQFQALDRGVDLLIATPGRLNDLIERQAVSLASVEVVVLDEADHMAEMGFLPEVTELLDQIPPGGQRLLFSATLDKGVDTIVERYLVDPVTHSTDSLQASITTMDHHILLVEPQHKKVVTAEVANREGHTIVFVRTKLGADRVALQLREQGVFAAALHGGLGQGARNRVLGAFRDGTLPVLVATDVAARGIHVDDVGVVMQVDPPADHKDYLHRAGRTARAGEKGTVITLALPHQRRLMQRIADEAGLGTSPQNVRPGDPDLTQMSGASRPSGVPIPEDRLRRLMEPPPRPRGGYRGGRPGGGHSSGGPRQGRPSGGRRY